MSIGKNKEELKELMSEETKTIELKDEELEKITGGIIPPEEYDPANQFNCRAYVPKNTPTEDPCVAWYIGQNGVCFGCAKYR